MTAAAGSELQLELELARRPAVYLRLDVGQSELQVKVRGIELERVPLRAVRVIVVEERSTEEEPPELQLPVVWRVAEPPAAEWRRVVAPPTLVPYSEEGVDEAPAVTPTPEAERPDQYRVALANGWLLHVGPSPPIGWWRRLGDRLATGWGALWGRPVEPQPPAVALEVTAESSRRLLHLFHKDLAILVVRSDPSQPSPTATS